MATNLVNIWNMNSIFILVNLRIQALFALTRKAEISFLQQTIIQTNKLKYLSEQYSGRYVKAVESFMFCS